MVQWTPERERLAEALAIERGYGDEAEHYITERIETLLRAGDESGVVRFRQIAAQLERLARPLGPAS